MNICSKKDSNGYVRCVIGIDTNEEKHDSYQALNVPIELIEDWRKVTNDVSADKKTRYFVEKYYNAVLKNVNPEEFYGIRDYYILTDDEEQIGFPVRLVVAAWLNILLEVEIGELGVQDNGRSVSLQNNDITRCLEEVMRCNRNMRGFTSLRALYLFEQGDKLEVKADELEEQYGGCYDHYRQQAAFYRSDADMAEYEYRSRQKTKQKTIGVKKECTTGN